MVLRISRREDKMVAINRIENCPLKWTVRNSNLQRRLKRQQNGMMVAGTVAVGVVDARLQADHLFGDGLESSGGEPVELEAEAPAGFVDDAVDPLKDPERELVSGHGSQLVIVYEQIKGAGPFLIKGLVVQSQGSEGFKERPVESPLRVGV